jgi:hypothetical protein
LAGGAIAAPMIVSSVPKVRDRYEAARTTTTVPLNEFTDINIFGSDTSVTYEPSDTYALEIESVGEINANAAKDAIKDGVLSLNTEDFRTNNTCAVFCIDTESVKLIVKAPRLLKVTIGSSSTFKIDTQLKQTDPLVVDMTPGGYFQMRHMNPDSVQVKTFAGSRNITLSGFGTGSFEDVIRDVDGWGLVIIRAKQLELSGDQVCDADEALIHIANVESVIVNGQSLSPDKLRAVRFDDRASDYNCVNAR